MAQVYKISVIIPIFDVEKYLRKCLDSVCNQTLKDIEIICVNDCSPDNSLEILKEYKSSDNRIKIIDFKENKGVAIARNTALAQAKGEYIGFVDPDDWIDLDFYEKLYNKAKEYNSDLVIGNIFTNRNGQDIQMPYVLSKFKENKVNFNGLFWLALYKKKMLIENCINFVDGLSYGEDRLFPILASYYSNNIKIIDDTYYHYYNRDDSLSYKLHLSNKKIHDFIVSSKMILKCVNGLNYNEEQYNLIIEPHLDTILLTLLNSNIDIQNELIDLYFNFISNLKYDKYLRDELNFSIYNAAKLNDWDKLRCLVNKKNNKIKIERLKIQLKSENKIKNIKVSAIIPVYNVEPYLRKCLDSVCNQTLKDIEIICVNDCSPDNSLEILKKYSKKDNRIKIIDFKENKGVSMARNAAIEQASGEYISFIDPDDYISENFFNELYLKAKTDDYDFVKGEIKEYNTEKNQISDDILSINDKIHKTGDKFFFCTYFTTGLYKREIIKKNNIKFFEDFTNGEDGIFLFDYVSNAKKIAVVNTCIYYYCHRENSANSQYLSDEKYNSLLKSYEIIFDRINKIDTKLETEKGLEFTFCFYFSNCIKIIFRNNNENNKKNAIKIALDAYLNCNFKDRINDYIKENYNSLLDGFSGNDINKISNNILNKSYMSFVGQNIRAKLLRNKGVKH